MSILDIIVQNVLCNVHVIILYRVYVSTITKNQIKYYKFKSPPNRAHIFSTS